MRAWNHAADGAELTAVCHAEGSANKTDCNSSPNNCGCCFCSASKLQVSYVGDACREHKELSLRSQRCGSCSIARIVYGRRAERRLSDLPVKEERLI